MRSIFLNPSRIAIAFVAALCCVMAVNACSPSAFVQQAPVTGVIAGCSGSSYLHDYSHGTCTREAMQQCEYTCMMPGGILDLNCYEDCIYSIC